MTINKTNNLDLLLKFLQISSVSTDDSFSGEMQKALSFLSQIFKEMEFKVKILPGLRHNLIFAEKTNNPSFPTVLIYGHYDVQPPEPISAWKSAPFKPVIRGGKIYARGASDDKGQIMIHIMAVKKLLQADKHFPINFKFIIEGEEEIGSISVPSIAKKYAQSLLKCDYLIVSDSEMPNPFQPSIDISLRGVTYMEVILKTSKQDLHSGVFGGITENPAIIMSNVVSKLKNTEGKILIPHFYDNVVSPKKFNCQKSSKLTKKQLTKEGGLYLIGEGEKGYSLNEKRWFRPTLDVNGFSSGFEQEGQKTIIPSQAMAKISMRLVPNQNPDKIAELFIKYVKSLVPKKVKLSFIKHVGSYPYLAPVDNPVFKIMAKALNKNFGKSPVFNGVGGSIGFVPIVAETLKVPCLMVGFGLVTDQIHSPNENFRIQNFSKGINTMIDFYNNLKK